VSSRRLEADQYSRGRLVPECPFRLHSVGRGQYRSRKIPPGRKRRGTPVGHRKKIGVAEPAEAGPERAGEVCRWTARQPLCAQEQGRRGSEELQSKTSRTARQLDEHGRNVFLHEDKGNLGQRVCSRRAKTA